MPNEINKHCPETPMFQPMSTACQSCMYLVKSPEGVVCLKTAAYASNVQATMILQEINNKIDDMFGTLGYVVRKMAEELKKKFPDMFGEVYDEIFGDEEDDENEEENAASETPAAPAAPGPALDAQNEPNEEG